MSTWITLNIVTENPGEMKDHLEQADINFGYVEGKELDDYTGVDLIAFAFTSSNPHNVEDYLELLENRKYLIERLFVVVANDTGDVVELIEYRKLSGSLKKHNEWKGDLVLKIGSPCQMKSGNKFVVEDLEEERGIRPSIGGNCI